MYILEHFSDSKLISNLFAFDSNELRTNKAKMIKKMNKHDKLYVCELNDNYTQERVICVIEKLTKRSL